MEGKNLTETLMGHSLESKIGEDPYPCDKTVEDSNSSELCENDGAGNVYGGNKADVRRLKIGKELVGGESEGLCLEGIDDFKDSFGLENVAGNKIRSLHCYAGEGNIVRGESNMVNDGNLLVLGADVSVDVSSSDLGKDTTLNVDSMDSRKGTEVSEELGVGKIVAEMTELKGEEASALHGADSAEKMELLGDGFNLFVEVFGPLGEQSDDANCEVENDTKWRSRERENVREGNGNKNNAKGLGDLGSVEMIQNAPGEATQRAEMESDTGSHIECRLNIGDLVWVKTKTQVWWPGLVCDPSNAPTGTAKSNQRDCILVKYFGNIHFVWCSPSELKPFLENLEHMSKQNKSRNFIGAVEKAIREIGRRVKVEMTCSCFSKGSQILSTQFSAQSKEVNAVPKEKTSITGALQSSQFEPATFLASVRCLAQSISMPGRIEVEIIQNRLSAFYHSVGHLQLPMQQLRPTEYKGGAQDCLEFKSKAVRRIKLYRGDSIGSQKVDVRDISGSMTLGSAKELENLNSESAGNDDPSTVRKSENGCTSRERRKSKYLSFPFVNHGLGEKKTPTLSDNETEGGSGLEAEINNKTSQFLASTPMTKRRGKTKRTGSRKILSGESTHIGTETTNVCSVKMLLDLRLSALDCLYPLKSECSDYFRKFFGSLRKVSFLNQDVDSQQDSRHEILQSGLPKASNFEHSRTKLEFSTERVSYSGNDVGLGGGNPQGIIHGSLNVNPKRRHRKKKEESNLSDPTPIPAAVGLSAIENDPHGMGYDTVKTSTIPKKRKKKSESPPGTELPDLNGNNTNLSVEIIHVTGPAASEGKREPKRRKRKEKLPSGSLQTDLHVVTTDVNSIGVKDHPFPNNIQFSISFQNNSQSISETGMCLNSESLARSSNANEHTVQSGSFIRFSEHVELLSNCTKPERKKRKRKENTLNISSTNVPSAIPDLNGNAAEPISLGKDLSGKSSASPGVKPQRKRRRNKAARIADINANYSSKMGNHVQALGGVLLLNFVAGSPPPSRGYLVSTFSVFGALKESETQFLNDSTAHVVFVRSSDAGVAYRSLEKANTFVPALASFRLHYLSSASRTPEKATNLQMLHSIRPTDGHMINPCVLKPTNGNAPDLQCIKQNVDMMTSMLEKAGDNLSPETKAKLETEIKGFMDKISSLVGPSSS